jgi:hypothetical protein
MKRGGILNRIDKQIWPDGADKAVQKLEPNVTLGTVSIFFVIFMAGLILSVIVLVVENCWYKLRHVKQETDVSFFKEEKMLTPALQNLAANGMDRTRRTSK